jgi:hypothetical protein
MINERGVRSSLTIMFGLEITLLTGMLTLSPDTQAMGILLGKTGFLQNVMFQSGQGGSGMLQRNQKVLQLCLTYTTNQLVETVSSY